MQQNTFSIFAFNNSILLELSFIDKYLIFVLIYNIYIPSYTDTISHHILILIYTVVYPSQSLYSPQHDLDILSRHIEWAYLWIPIPNLPSQYGIKKVRSSVRGSRDWRLFPPLILLSKGILDLKTYSHSSAYNLQQTPSKIHFRNKPQLWILPTFHSNVPVRLVCGLTLGARDPTCWKITQPRTDLGKQLKTRLLRRRWMRVGCLNLDPRMLQRFHFPKRRGLRLVRIIFWFALSKIEISNSDLRIDTNIYYRNV